MSTLPALNANPQSIARDFNWGLFAKGAQANFQLAFNTPASPVAMAAFNRIVQTVPAESFFNIFPGVTALGEMVDTPSGSPVPMDTFNDYAVSVRVREFQKGFKLTWGQILADRQGINRLISMPSRLANVAQRNRFKLLYQQLVGNAPWDYDGLPFFDPDHYFGSNSITVQVSSVTNLSQQDADTVLNEVMSVAMAYKDTKDNAQFESGDWANMVVVVPPKFNAAFLRLQNRTMITDGIQGDAVGAVDNINNQRAATFSRWMWPRLAANDSNYIYVFFSDPTSRDGNNLGQSAPLARAVLQDYMLDTGGGADDQEWRSTRVISTTCYGAEGIGFVDATRAIRVDLATD